MKFRGFLLVIITFLLLCSCSTFHVNLPEGFALVYQGESFLAVSPEGLKFRVKTDVNYPQKDVTFWSSVLKRQLKEEGYRTDSEGEYFECPAGKGFFIEWNVPYQGGTYTYLTGLVPDGKTIYIAEAAAEYSVYRSYREAILESFQSLATK